MICLKIRRKQILSERIKNLQEIFKNSRGERVFVDTIKVFSINKELLDIRHIKMLEEIKDYTRILEVGPGNGRLGLLLLKKGKEVDLLEVSFTEEQKIMKEVCDEFNFPHNLFIGKLPYQHNIKRTYEVVIVSEVIEHVPNYQEAIEDLLKLTEKKLILTTPVEKSYFSPEHVHFFKEEDFEFIKKDFGFTYSIEKIKTKILDGFFDYRDFFIVVDK